MCSQAEARGRALAGDWYPSAGGQSSGQGRRATGISKRRPLASADSWGRIQTKPPAGAGREAGRNLAAHQRACPEPANERAEPAVLTSFPCACSLVSEFRVPRAPSPSFPAFPPLRDPQGHPVSLPRPGPSGSTSHWAENTAFPPRDGRPGFCGRQRAVEGRAQPACLSPAPRGWKKHGSREKRPHSPFHRLALSSGTWRSRQLLGHSCSSVAREQCPSVNRNTNGLSS